MVLCYTMIVLKLYCSASPGERGGKPPQQVHTEAHPIHRVSHDDNENDGCANEKEINRFLLFSVSCKAESGETGHRGHRCIFPLLVCKSLSLSFAGLQIFIFYLLSLVHQSSSSSGLPTRS